MSALIDMPTPRISLLNRKANFMTEKQKSPPTSKQPHRIAKILGAGKISCVDDTKRLQLIVEAVRYCQRVKKMGMPPSCYSKALREPVYFLWERRAGSKINAPEFRSKDAIGLSFGNAALVYDHSVPFKYLQAELLKLSDVTTRSVRSVLNDFGAVVLITKEEDDLLNAAGYRSDMPEDWDGIDLLARCKAVGIEIVENTNISN